jgi:Delta7-sterol 5-desaturase
MTCIHDLLAGVVAVWPFIWVADLLRYLIVAAFVAALLVLAPARWLAPRSVRIRAEVKGQRRREFAWSMLTVVIFSMVGTSVLLAYNAGFARIYFVADDYGWAYLFASVFLVIVLHDAWFYWTHRLMHHRRVFRWAHQLHHRSLAPTPWTAYSFAPGEALVQALFLPAVLLVVPLHQTVIFVWMAHMVVRNVLGHAGTELVPRAWLAAWWGRWLTTTLHHEMHHAHGRHNYGLYFVWWDRWCGTEHPDYRQNLALLVQKLSPSTKLRSASAARQEVASRTSGL